MAKMVTIKKRLSSRQIVAIETLLISGSAEQAAQAAGVTAKTVYAWLKQKRFSEAVQQAEFIAIKGLAEKLIALGGKAADAIEDGLDPDQDIKIRLRAAEAYFTKSIAWLEFMSIEQRVRAIEKALKG